MPVISRTLAFCLASSSLWLAPACPAQTFPSKVVKVAVPYSAGAGPTVFMRVIGDKLSRIWGQQVIVDARPGAAGFLAIEAVKNAPPDGHDILLMSNAHVAINPALFKKLPYDPERDFTPLALIYETSFFVAVAASGPYQGIQALIAAARANPGRITYATPNVGSTPHLKSAEFELLTGTKMIAVPFKDQSQLYVAIASGDVTWALSTLGSALPFLNSGRIRFLAIAKKQRLKALPEVPTVEEAGGPAGFEALSWLALFAPRGTPLAIVQRINADVTKQLGEPDVLERLHGLGFEAALASPAQIAEMIRADARTYGELVRRTGVSAE
ncbi:MAG: tripartite tricarboxylate transporter substrate binding protein [Betaproteobacteria bacterium]|nr:tripartite tricarboxylate transporter substrate binding protein [Betaproteobacteria bacterium]